MEENSKIN